MMFSDRAESVEVEPIEPPFGAEWMASRGLRGLNAGCAAWNLRAGWLNVDIATLSAPEGRSTPPGRVSRINGERYYLVHDVTTPFPIPDGAFEWIYTEHLIEHLDRQGAAAFLREARRLLKPGGLLRVTTPDLARYIDGYRDADQAFFKKQARLIDFLHRAEKELGAGEEIPVVEQRPAWMVNQIFQHWGHRWIYDFEEMSHALVEAGFEAAAITQRSFRKGQSPEVSALDLVPRRDETLYVEAIRS